MTSMPYNPAGESGGSVQPAPGNGKPGNGMDERRAKWRQGAERARERIRNSNGRDGNGLRDVARRVSDTAKQQVTGSAAGRAAAMDEANRVTGTKTGAPVSRPR